MMMEFLCEDERIEIASDCLGEGHILWFASLIDENDPICWLMGWLGAKEQNRRNHCLDPSETIVTYPG